MTLSRLTSTITSTRCGGLAKMPDIRSAEILRFCTISRNTCSSKMLVLMLILNRNSVFEFK